MVGKSIDSLKVTHEEVINTMAMQMAALNMELTVVKLENQKLKEYLGEYLNSSPLNDKDLNQK
jgi:regulator of replication initiation timing